MSSKFVVFFVIYLLCCLPQFSSCCYVYPSVSWGLLSLLFAVLFIAVSPPPRFIQLCQKMIETECLSWECVERECLPLLLRLYADQVPNVRIAVAKVAKLILADETLCKCVML